MNYAGFFSRFIAFLIDGVAVAVLAWVVAMALGALTGLTAATGVLGIVSGALALLTVAVMAFFHFFYFGWTWSRSGQSVGMRLLNIRVVRRQSESSLGFWRAGLRGTMGYYISGLVFSLGFIWAAFDSRKETWHDKLFDTWVVKA